MKFTDEIKQAKEFNDSPYFGYGVHKVQIDLVEFGSTDNGKEYIEVSIVGENGEEDKVRVWFTSVKAATYSWNVLRLIAVHNTPEDKRDEMKAKFDALEDPVQMADLMTEFYGKECWFTKYPSKDRTYLASDGSTKKSIDKNIMGYEPKPQPDRIPQSDKDMLNQTFPEGDGPVDLNANAKIPNEWS